MEYEKNAQVFKALGEANRLRVLTMLRRGERCACELLEELHIQQSTLSHHMRILCAAGLVAARKEGKWMHYTLSREGMLRSADLLRRIAALPEEGAESSPCCAGENG